MKISIRALLPTLLIFLLVPAATFAQFSQPNPQAAQSDAKRAFAKLKSLSGSWQGSIMDTSIDLTIRAASSGTAILHEAHTDGGKPPNHEITMFYVEGDRLLATHFCDGGNRAYFEGKFSKDEKSIEFSFLKVEGSTRGGVLKELVITLNDADHHIVAFTFVMPDGKPMQLRGEFQRTK
jgi:hypothetical protein